MTKIWVILCVFAMSLSSAWAKETPLQIVTYPQTGSPVVRLTFMKFKQMTNGVGQEKGYVTDVMAENLSDKAIGSLTLALYVFDKTKVRIGEGDIRLTNVPAGQTVKFEVTVYITGTPASLAVEAKSPQAKLISITVNSVPQGADLKVDGNDVGTTPKIVEVGVGKHMLDFNKDGFNAGHFPLEMGPRDTSGGSVSYELGVSSHDTIELRDGSVLSGDLLSVTGSQVQVRIGGTTQTFDRNQVKRILLTTREPVN